MASDSFTGTNGTALATHDAQWTSISATHVVSNLKIDTNQCTLTNAFVSGGAYYASSAVDLSQIVFKGAGSSATKSVCTRAGTNARGYAISLSTPSGGNWTALQFRKNGSFLTSAVVSVSIASDHTLKVTTSGTSTVTITGFVDGVQAGQTTDSSSPIASGSPGFFIDGGGTGADNYFDDWTDGASGLAIAVLMDSYKRRRA